MATTAFHKKVDYVSPTRKRVMGIVFIVFGLFIFAYFGQQVEAGIETTFVMNPGGSTLNVPDWILPSAATLNVLAFISLMLGGIQLSRARGFGNRTNTVLGIVAGMFVFAFLVWAAADKSLNLVGLLNTAVSKAIPITLGALSGILCERAGVVNIAIEGMMLTGAMIGALVGSMSGSLFIGMVSAVIGGGMLGLLHAILSIKYKTDQIVSGTIINISAAGITSYISAKFMQENQSLNNPGIYRPFEIPLLSEIPVIGPIFFNNNFFVYMTFIFLIVLTVALYYTRWGLRLRSVGEHPKAADRF